MIIRIMILGFAAGLILSFFSCNSEEQRPKVIGKRQLDSAFVEANKHLVKSENEQIEDFIRRYKWNMTKTTTGLRYQIYQKGQGEPVTTGKVVKLHYILSLLSGDTCYTSHKDGLKVFLVGKGGVEPGLEEAILFLRKGDKAKIIVPSHLAFGLLGDQRKIPQKAVLVYDLEVTDVTTPNEAR